MEEVDLFVIGGGSAGMKAARTAVGMGQRVALAELRETGGECFWAGCVPTKALLWAASVWQMVREADKFGIHPEKLRTDFAEAMTYKESVMRVMSGGAVPDADPGIPGVHYFHAAASLEDQHHVRVQGNVVKTSHILVATGTDPAIPAIPGLSEAGYITNREAVHLTSLPARLVVLGGGPIGLEFAQMIKRFGSEVTVLERSSHVLSNEDHEISELAETLLKQEGIRILTGVTVERVSHTAVEKTVHILHNDQREAIACSDILVATGRKPATGGLCLDAAGIAEEKEPMKTDGYLRTQVPGIYAAGDVNGGFLFTHVASYAGGLAARNMFGSNPRPMDVRVVPRCTYIDPEVASIGITEKEARAQCLPFRTRCCSFADVDRAILTSRAAGLVKLILDARDDQILGAHIIGPEASSILGEIAVCMKNRLPVQAISSVMHAYPSFPEAIEAAALSQEDC